MQESIIIIGGGIMQLPVIKQAQKMNLQVWVVDGNPKCMGFKYILENRQKMNDNGYNLHTLTVDISSEDEVFEKIRTVFQKSRPNGILTVGTDYSRTVSKVGDYYRLATLPYSLSSILTNKYLMRKELSNAGFAQPRFKCIASADEFVGCLEYFTTLVDAVVIKPVDSMGARGVKLLELKKLNQGNKSSVVRDYLDDYYNALRFSRSKTVIMEEKISGKEYSLDALVFGDISDEASGHIQITGVADRIIEHSPYFVETGHVIPSRQPVAVVGKLEAGFKAAVRSLVSRSTYGSADGKKEKQKKGEGSDQQTIAGAFKGDVFFTDDEEVVVGEIAGRLSGGYMSGYTYPLSTGVNLMEAAIHIALGKNPLPLQEKQLGVVVEKALISKPGRVVRIEGAQDARTSSGVEELFMHVKAGEKIEAPQNNLMKSANIITRAGNYQEADECANAALAKIKVYTS